jgi:hypothetical protein
MLHSLKLGVSGGILWGGCMAISTILALYTGYLTPFLNIMSSVYPGYDISWMGVLSGLIYGFVDAFVGFYLLAWLYNNLPIK